MAENKTKASARLMPINALVDLDAMSTRARERRMTAVHALGTGAVATQTKAVGFTGPNGGTLTAVNFSGQSAVAGTSLTAMLQVRALDGNTATNLLSAALDLKITAATDGIVQAASLTATVANLILPANCVIEVVYTATAITTGPGDVTCEAVVEPAEDSVLSR